MLTRIHAVAGLLAGATILTFWLSTAVVELGGSAAAVTAVKTAIPWGLLLLIPALALTGATGFRLAGKREDALVQAKRRRMPIIAGNGLLTLVPAAFFLALRRGLLRGAGHRAACRRRQSSPDRPQPARRSAGLGPLARRGVTSPSNAHRYPCGLRTLP